MLDDAFAHPAVVTLEDGYREGGIGAAIAGRLAERACRPEVRQADGRTPRLSVLGVPVQFIPHGKPDAILASFGLDAAGVTATARDLVTRRG
jgi:1-deoxy-D-xylulose-5-phosphate synthase